MKVRNWKLAILTAVMAFGAVTAAGHFAGDEAQANQCAAQCYAQENACRRATNDDPKCGAELTKCLQSCRGK